MEHEWDFYLCQVEDRPASIFLDLGLRQAAPCERRAELVWVRVPMQTPRDDGMSSKQEMDSLCRIEDALSSAAERHGDTIYAGRNTCDGFRDFYFYATDRIVETHFAAAADVRL